MSSVRDDLEAASEDLKRAVEHAGDEMKSEVQSASSRLAALADDVEEDVEGAGESMRGRVDDLLRDVDGLIERSTDETAERLERVRERLRAVGEGESETGSESE